MHDGSEFWSSSMAEENGINEINVSACVKAHVMRNVPCLYDRLSVTSNVTACPSFITHI